MTGNQTRRARGRPQTFDRVRALDVAVDAYMRDGIEAVSINGICRRAKVSKPGLYREFGAEDQFLAAALAHYHETVLAPGMAILAADRPFRETLDALIDFATSEETADAPAGCLLATMRTQRGELGPAAAERVEQLGAEVVQAFAAWLDRCERKGEIQLPAPLETVATYVDAQVTLMANRMSEGHDRQLVRSHAYLAFSILNPSRS